VISTVFGNYNGFMDFDNTRYLDLRNVSELYFNYTDLPSAQTLPSDSTKRHDLLLMETMSIDQAQGAKDEIEQMQRADRKLR